MKKNPLCISEMFGCRAGKSVWLFIFLLVAIAAVYGVLLLPADLRYALLLEDGPVENVSAGFWLASFVICLYLFCTDRRGNDFHFIKPRKNLFLLGLAVLFFFGFGEEISWGQRIFGLETPELMRELNEQNEINIHNLAGFQVERLFSVFWFLYAVIIPLINRLSHRFAEWMKCINLPIVPLWIGLIFPINYILSKFMQPSFQGNIENMPIEIKEFNFALLFCVISFRMLIRRSKAGETVSDQSI